MSLKQSYVLSAMVSYELMTTIDLILLIYIVPLAPSKLIV